MKLKLLVLDIDGTLTNGGITHLSDGTESKTFNVKDGLILKCLPKFGIECAVITGRNSEIIVHRTVELGIKYVIQGCDDKLSALEQLLSENGLTFAQTAYIGDDLNDYAAMRLCAFKICPSDAAEEIRELADYVSLHNGGHGAVRDCCEHLLKQQGKFESFLKLWGIK